MPPNAPAQQTTTHKVKACWIENIDGVNRMVDEEGTIYMLKIGDPRPSSAIPIGHKQKETKQEVLIL